MHEMSLAESAMQIIEEAARKQGCKRIRTVWLEIGRLAAVEPEAMRFCFDVVTRGSIAEGAQLEIVETAGHGKCAQCGCETLVTELYQPCPECGSHALNVTGGVALRVKELEVE